MSRGCRGSSRASAAAGSCASDADTAAGRSVAARAGARAGVWATRGCHAPEDTDRRERVDVVLLTRGMRGGRGAVDLAQPDPPGVRLGVDELRRLEPHRLELLAPRAPRRAERHEDEVVVVHEPLEGFVVERGDRPCRPERVPLLVERIELVDVKLLGLDFGRSIPVPLLPVVALRRDLRGGARSARERGPGRDEGRSTP